jgi:hypothetical protein
MSFLSPKPTSVQTARNALSPQSPDLSTLDLPVMKSANVIIVGTCHTETEFCIVIYPLITYQLYRGTYYKHRI